MLRKKWLNIRSPSSERYRATAASISLCTWSPVPCPSFVMSVPRSKKHHPAGGKADDVSRCTRSKAMQRTAAAHTLDTHQAGQDEPAGDGARQGIHCQPEQLEGRPGDAGALGDLVAGFCRRMGDARFVRAARQECWKDQIITEHRNRNGHAQTPLAHDSTDKPLASSRQHN